MSRHSDLEAGARALFLKLTARKWRLIRIFESLARVVLPLLPSPPPPDVSRTEPNRILVMEYWNLGDLAILVPFLRHLRGTFPKARISLLVNAALASFLEGQGLVDEFIAVRVPWAQHFNRWKKYNPFSLNWASFARAVLALRKRQFDLAFSGRMDIRDNFLLWLSNARRRIGYGFAGGGLFLTDSVLPDLSRPHRSDVWLYLLRAVNKPSYSTTGSFQLTDTARASARAFLDSQRIPINALVIGVHPGARIPIRRWGDERFTEVALRLLEQKDVHILWFVEPGSIANPPSHDRCHAACLDFGLFLAVLSRCRLLVCNDSGPMHLANLLNVPLVAIFGSTNPVWFGPRGPRDRVVIRPEMWCRPCFDYCIFDQPYCLRTITSGEVISSVREALRDLDAERLFTEETCVATASKQRASDV